MVRAPGWISRLSVQCLILAQVCDFEPEVILCAASAEPDGILSVSLCLSVSLSQNK